MKNLFKSLILIFLFSIQNITSFSQSIEMADGMRANGKIYVVVAVLMIVFLSLSVYLFVLDKKISRLENDKKQGSNID